MQVTTIRRFPSRTRAKSRGNVVYELHFHRVSVMKSRSVTANAVVLSQYFAHRLVVLPLVLAVRREQIVIRAARQHTGLLRVRDGFMCFVGRDAAMAEAAHRQVVQGDAPQGEKEPLLLRASSALLPVGTCLGGLDGPVRLPIALHVFWIGREVAGALEHQVGCEFGDRRLGLPRPTIPLRDSLTDATPPPDFRRSFVFAGFVVRAMAKLWRSRHVRSRRKTQVPPPIRPRRLRRLRVADRPQIASLRG